MRSIFVNPPYGRYDMGRFVMAARHPTMPIELGQRQETAYSLVDDILEAVGLGESDIVSLIDALPIANRGVYKDKLEECKKLGLTSSAGAACIYALFRELKDVVEGEKRPEAPRPPAVQPVTRPAPAAFPLLPVALGGLAAAGLVYFLATR